jgi:hypothetical protein
MADDSGRILDNVKIIDAFIFPETSETCRDALATLSRMCRIERGKTSSGQSVIQITNWSKHQKVDKPNNKTCLPPIVKKPNENKEENDFRDAFANDSRRSRDALALRPTTDDHGPTTDDLICPIASDDEVKKTETKKAGNGYTDEFLRFWAVFPKHRRTGKQEAFRRWKTALKTTTADCLTMRACEYAKSEKGRSEYAVMPSTWLNKGMWEDEPEAWGEVERDRTPTTEDLLSWTPGGST